MRKTETSAPQKGFVGVILMEKIKLLGISASPRKTGNSQYLLERAISGAGAAGGEMVESEMYSIAGKTLEPPGRNRPRHS
jgi:hypothetical protein